KKDQGAKHIRSITQQITLWTKTNIAVLIATLVIVPERVTPSLSRRIVEPAAREKTSSSLNPHHGCTRPGVLDRRFTLKIGFSPVVEVSFASNIVGRYAVMRQADDPFLPAAPPQLAGIKGKWLSDAFDAVEQPYLAANELTDPDRHSVRPAACAANVHEGLHWQYRINRNLADPPMAA